MEKKVYFTPWQGVDVSIEVSLFEYGYVMRRKRGTNEWQVLHRLHEWFDDGPMYDIDWFSPDDYIKDAESEEEPWFKPSRMIETNGYESVEDMIECWKNNPCWCFDDLYSYWGMYEVLGSYHYATYTEKEVRKRLGRAIGKYKAQF